MSALIDTPLERTVAGWWGNVDPACRRAFFAALGVNVLAFGWEMTNLTLHHDDVIHFFIQDTILGHFLGRFGHGWLYYYTQNHYFMPFLQMLQGIVLMSVYGVLVAHFWGLRRTVDIAVAAAIMCVFPYMANIYQYNTTMWAYPAAHLLVALAVVLATRATVAHVAIASLLYVAAFSIYQAVVANAATIFVIWLLSRHLFAGESDGLLSRPMLRATVAVVASALAGGLIYLGIVSLMNIEPDTVHSSEEAFHLRGVLTPMQGIAEVWRGTRSFLVWPETYFPDYLKALQGALLVAAGIFCLWLPRPPSATRSAAAGAKGPFPQPHAHRLCRAVRGRDDDRLSWRPHACAQPLDRRDDDPARGLCHAVQLDLDGQLPQHTCALFDADAGPRPGSGDSGRAMGWQENRSCRKLQHVDGLPVQADDGGRGEVHGREAHGPAGSPDAR
jgi:hypothetical protein